MEREKKIIRTGILGIIVNVILVLFKAMVGFITNSIAIVLDAVNNSTDALSSIITIIGTKLAGKAPDKEHPYGHGRIEYVTSVIVSFIVLIAGVTSLKESFEKILIHSQSNYSIVSMIIIAVAVVVKFIFGRYVKKVGKDLNSQSLIASGQDAFMDSILSFSTLIAAIINYIWHIGIEGYIGIAISFVIIRSAIEMLKETLDIVIGTRADEELTKKIREKVCEYENVQGAYDLTIHTYGPTKTVGTIHIQIPDNMTAKEIHALTKKITVDIFNEFGIIMTVGIYAANDKAKYREIKEDIDKITSNYKYIKQVHGFFVDEKKNNIYFDILFDFECKNRNEIKDEIIENLKSKYPEYNFYIILDDDITD